MALGFDRRTRRSATGLSGLALSLTISLYPSDITASVINAETALSGYRTQPQMLTQGPSPNLRQTDIDQLLQQGLEHYRTSQFDKALNLFQQALELAQILKDRQREGRSLSNLGISYYAMGQYAKAIELHQQSLSIFRDIKDRQREGVALNNLGIVYYALGQYDKAMAYYQQRLAIARDIKDTTGEVNGLTNLGNTYYSLEQYDQAIAAHRQSLRIARAMKDRWREGNALNNLGNTYHALKQYDKAIESYQQRLAIARAIKDRRGEGSALGNLGIVYRALGQYQQAIEYQQQRLAIARDIQDREAEGSGLNNLGIAQYYAGMLPQAEQNFVAAITLYEALRANLTDLDKVSLADAQQQAYNNLQRALIAQNKVKPALEISERSRARAFTELIAKQIQGRDFPVVQPIQIETIQQIAREQNATLVEYANLYDTHLFIWVVKPSGEVIFREVNLKPLEQEKTSLDNLVTAARCLGAIGCEDVVTSRGSSSITFNVAQGNRQFSKVPDITISNKYLKRLHQLLIDPIADLLPEKPNDRIIFIPQGRLFLLPFAALQDQQNQYLIEKHTISIAPSIQILQLTRQQRQRNSAKVGDVLLVGNPKMPFVTYQPGEPPSPLVPLPGAERETQAIAQLLKVPTLTGQQATETVVRTLMPKARIIHLATHGLLDDLGNSGVPGAIALASDNTHDGLLTANEMLDPRFTLQAELVVLSACDTGRGKVTGDGVIGLSRSLMAAGAPSVVVSLWQVPDGPTADFMIAFYRYLQQGQNKATALRQAMLDTQKDYPDPIAWASFVLVGEAE